MCKCFVVSVGGWRAAADIVLVARAQIKGRPPDQEARRKLDQKQRQDHERTRTNERATIGYIQIILSLLFSLGPTGASLHTDEFPIGLFPPDGASELQFVAPVA